VKVALERVTGVRYVETNFKERTAKVTFNQEEANTGMLLDAVAATGVFEASLVRTSQPEAAK
jgi:copper chaperone CopZ